MRALQKLDISLSNLTKKRAYLALFLCFLYQKVALLLLIILKLMNVTLSLCALPVLRFLSFKHLQLNFNLNGRFFDKISL